MKCLFLSLQQLLEVSLERSNPKWQYFVQKWLLPRGGRQTFSDFMASTPTKKPLPCFQSISLPLPLPLSKMSSISWTQSFFFLLFISMLFQSFVSGSHLFVFDWSTQRVGFSKNHGHSHWLSCWKEKEESAVSMEWGREKKSRHRRAPSPLRWRRCVCMCVRVWVCVSLCQ